MTASRFIGPSPRMTTIVTRLRVTRVFFPAQNFYFFPSVRCYDDNPRNTQLRFHCSGKARKCASYEEARNDRNGGIRSFALVQQRNDNSGITDIAGVSQGANVEAKEGNSQVEITPQFGRTEAKSQSGRKEIGSLFRKRTPSAAFAHQMTSEIWFADKLVCSTASRYYSAASGEHLSNSPFENA